ncbi:FAD-dependent oxidoreductase [Agrobacterium rosae]|uniref:FAD-binding protein n=1 Tax=Agrobacterium rosae TaxID=1972867 RepID=A0AAE5RW15_9HYPH|nr:MULTISPECIES: FAD-dependent oxidoreductase [Agrobacterium]KAA3515866.1 FAD-dependent oxidoreductase [Agrobacterium rosae]KAA3524820.1 FAD-dependent oxidoreductase [Agrobacterium rosae]MBN7803827.1 FAD-dependent oxidoreductase [Agrobacterium rosae]MCM2431781.1 FAD-dependent oxidoreductase [Agrobacterium rosae]MDX8312222.1 FAD-dependent oxidoreductase [Agrobacterium rosae]
MAVLSAEGVTFDFEMPVVVVGAGACGLVAALAAHDAGQEVMVLERDENPTGSTSLSAGLIPAPCTRLQKEAGIEDSPELFAQDLVAKTHDHTPHDMALVAAQTAGPMIDWLMDTHKVEFELVTGFTYPGHSRLRMHGPKSRTGADLEQSLLSAVSNADIDVVTNASVEDLYVDASGHVTGVRFRRPDGALEMLGCKALVLASCGFAGDVALVQKYIPEIADAECCGHLSNTGDAVKWGAQIGAALADMGAYQGHGSVAHPHALPLTWAVITKGGILLNTQGQRFSNEMRGYSEHAAEVAAQPDHVAWDIYDAKGDEAGMGFYDYREIRKLGAIKTATSLEDLATVTGLSLSTIREEFEAIETSARTGEPDRFGRNFTPDQLLSAPFYAVKVNGALFHTQGGLVIDAEARVLREDGTVLPNLLAGGGAARGVSGDSNYGYLSGNGLLTATSFGRLAGITAARIAAES